MGAQGHVRGEHMSHFRKVYRRYSATNVRTRSLSGSALALALAGFGLTAVGERAQAATPVADQSSNTLQEIIITARKRAEPLQAAPVSISATTGATLQKAQVTRIDDIAQFAPSLDISEQTGYAGTINVSMRGIGDNDPILTNDSPVAIYIDGVYLGREAGALADLMSIDHIEVLRGPQGTLFGRNTTGGAISVFTKAPSQQFGAEEQAGYASNNEITSTTTLNTGDIAGSGITALLTYRRHQMDGYRRNTLTSWANSQGAQNTDEVAGAVHAEPIKNLTLDYRFDYQHLSTIPTAFQVVAAAPTLASYFSASPSKGGAPFTPPSLTRQDSYADFNHPRAFSIPWGTSFTLNYYVNDGLKFKSITAYRSMYESNNSDLGDSGQLVGLSSTCPPALAAGKGCQGTPETLQNVYVEYTNYNHEWATQFSEELQAGGTYGDWVYVGGLYYFKEDVRGTNSGVLNLPLSGPAVGFPNVAPFNQQALTSLTSLNYTGTSSSEAAFAQTSYSPTQIFNKKLELTVGLRYTSDRKTLNQNDTIAVRNLQHNFDNFSQSASLKYQWTPTAMTYFRYANAYKAGGYSARAVINGTSPTGAYLPEKAQTYELGAKTEWLDHRVRLNADVYDTDYIDFQVNSLTGSPQGLLTTVYNAGKVNYKGGEAELTVLPAVGWELNATLGYVHPKTTEFIVGVPLAPRSKTAVFVNVASIANYAGSADMTASASLQYKFPEMSVGNLTVRGDWSYLGPRYYVAGDFKSGTPGVTPGTPATNTVSGLPYINAVTRAPAFNNVGIQFILSDIPIGHEAIWSATFYVKNLLDEHEELGALDLTSIGVIEAAWGRGRVLGLNLDAKF